MKTIITKTTNSTQRQQQENWQNSANRTYKSDCQTPGL